MASLFTTTRTKATSAIAQIPLSTTMTSAVSRPTRVILTAVNNTSTRSLSSLTPQRRLTAIMNASIHPSSSSRHTPAVTTAFLSAARTSSHFHSSAISSSISNKDTASATKRPETRPCWKCSTPVPYLALQCTNPDCKVVQTLAPGVNYFEILGLSPEPCYDVDLKDLRLKFFKIQQLIHPDSYSQNTNGDQVYAQQQSSLANKAYSTLKEPLSRANYMLELLGAPIHESESLNEPELLMEVMEARELLEEAQTEDEVQELKNVNDARIKDTVEGLSKAFKGQDLEQAKTLAIELQYWIRIQNVIRDWVAGHPIVADHV
ncbi:hypothetical protein BG015_005106 [Linnemannia schmuckeri]|uniref:J domain-containing protein n=1 Tax=Linnemannia schmuckeri TaxID=64567 RepID=A0A9P5S3T2_9FUNG|nr:hypothetical protein BG015_005106 [Linnemannia schmuckeri]